MKLLSPTNYHRIKDHIKYKNQTIETYRNYLLNTNQLKIYDHNSKIFDQSRLNSNEIISNSNNEYLNQDKKEFLLNEISIDNTNLTDDIPKTYLIETKSDDNPGVNNNNISKLANPELNLCNKIRDDVNSREDLITHQQSFSSKTNKIVRVSTPGLTAYKPKITVNARKITNHSQPSFNMRDGRKICINSRAYQLTI